MDTPGFHPLDLAHEGSFSSELRAAMTTTSPGHRGGTSVSESSGSVIEATQAVGFDDNGVSLDREAAKLAANNVRYDALANVMSHSLSMLNWAANDGKGG
jgi:flagellar basal body rod protein FlgB